MIPHISVLFQSYDAQRARRGGRRFRIVGRRQQAELLELELLVEQQPRDVFHAQQGAAACAPQPADALRPPQRHGMRGRAPWLAGDRARLTTAAVHAGGLLKFRAVARPVRRSARYASPASAFATFLKFQNHSWRSRTPRLPDASAAATSAGVPCRSRKRPMTTQPSTMWQRVVGSDVNSPLIPAAAAVTATRRENAPFGTEPTRTGSPTRSARTPVLRVHSSSRCSGRHATMR